MNTIVWFDTINNEIIINAMDIIEVLEFLFSRKSKIFP